MNLKGQCCLMSSYRRWGVKSQMLQFCKSNFGSVLNVRKCSNLLQVSGLWMYQVPLVYSCAGSKGSAGIFLFIPLCTSEQNLRSPLREFVSHFSSLLGTGGEGRDKQVPVSEPLAALCRSGSPSMKSALGTRLQQGMEVLQNQRNPVCMSPQLLLFPLFGVVPEDYTKKSFSVNGYEYLNTIKYCHDIKVLRI